MGPYSTIQLSKDEVINRILALIDTASDEELCDALFALTNEHCLDNYSIKDENDE